jgi:RNA polymerase sigma-70 factor (ECF subfamily)
MAAAATFAMLQAPAMARAPVERYRTPVRPADRQELSVPRLSAAAADEQAQSVALVRRCISGEAAAWEEIVRLHNRRIYNLCYRFTGSQDDAQDLTQEVFIKVYRTLKTYDLAKGGFTTWLTTLTRNLLVDHYRASKQQRMTESLDAGTEQDPDAPALTEKLPDTGISPEGRMQQQDTQKLVQQALDKLSPELREAVVLRDLQDMDYREIAQVLRVPEGTVKSRINRGRTELGRLLERIYKQAGQ